MVYYQDWAEFFRASEALLRASGGRARCVTKYRHSSGQLVLKVTDDATVRSASPPPVPRPRPRPRPRSRSRPQPPLGARPFLPTLNPPDGGEGGGRWLAGVRRGTGREPCRRDRPPPPSSPPRSLVELGADGRGQIFQCLKYKTDQIQDMKKMEKLNNLVYLVATHGPDARLEDLDLPAPDQPLSPTRGGGGGGGAGVGARARTKWSGAGTHFVPRSIVRRDPLSPAARITHVRITPHIFNLSQIQLSKNAHPEGKYCRDGPRQCSSAAKARDAKGRALTVLPLDPGAARLDRLLGSQVWKSL